jgi:hypothetical protein
MKTSCKLPRKNIQRVKNQVDGRFLLKAGFMVMVDFFFCLEYESVVSHLVNPDVVKCAHDDVETHLLLLNVIHVMIQS